VATLGDYIRQLREVDNERNQSCVACVAPESSFQHICPNNPILTCNCANPNACPELGADPDGASNGVDGNKQCPDSGKICNERVCPSGTCNGDGFADNLEYAHIGGIPVPKPEIKHAGWPCVVVGAVCETWLDPAEFVSSNTFPTTTTGRDADAGQCDGPYVSTNH
jgi:hypothetical protein